MSERPARTPRAAAFLRGVASILDLGGTLNRDRLEPMPTDEEALRGDWEAVGADFRAVLGDPAPKVRKCPKRGRSGALRRR